jgi:uncharacterized protein YjbI with pentapeptide repeats
MANPEHLDILQQGVAAWNQWRRQHRGIRPDLREADLRRVHVRKADPGEIDLRGIALRSVDFSRINFRDIDFTEGDLRGIDLREADLTGANLRRVSLCEADLSRADLSRADLSQANLRKAILRRTKLRGVFFGSNTDLRQADFRQADLSGAYFLNVNLTRSDLRQADLFHARLTRSDLSHTTLVEANLRRTYFDGVTFVGANLSRVVLSGTVFSNTDLTDVEDLETCDHRGPSTLDHRTLAISGPLPLAFLRGCGLPDALINYLPSLLNEPFQFYSCFISYASKDHAFAERLYADLQNHGVRCWFAPEDMKIGDRFRLRIDETIRVYDKLLLVLSRRSIASQWVEQEVETALARERQQGMTILFPVRIDNTVMTIETGWPALIRNTRNIGDFRRWKTHGAYQQAFDRLLRDLTTAAQQPDASA